MFFSEFLETANFLSIISNWWKTVNVKSKFLAQRKRDKLREIVTSENLIEKTSFLRAFVDWLVAWELATNGTKWSLSKETFNAAKQTSEGLASLCEYLINEKKQPYVLLGKFQSDKLEGRFGKHRHMSGGNMFASVRQFVESERTLKIKNLALLDLSLSEIQDIFKPSEEENEAVIKSTSEKLFEGLNTGSTIELPSTIPEADENILFYVAGYFSRTIANHLKCNDCKKILISGEKSSVNVIIENDPSLSSDENTKRIAYITEVNRGGLVFPSEQMFSACILLWDMYQKIKNQRSLSQLLYQPNISSQKVFSETFIKYLNSCENTRSEYLLSECEEGHSFTDSLIRLARKFFNVVSKNYVSNKNSEIHAKKKRKLEDDSTKRNCSTLKISKLQSETLQ